jgi:hypothetical protein
VRRSVYGIFISTSILKKDYIVELQKIKNLDCYLPLPNEITKNKAFNVEANDIKNSSNLILMNCSIDGKHFEKRPYQMTAIKTLASHGLIDKKLFRREQSNQNPQN